MSSDASEKNATLYEIIENAWLAAMRERLQGTDLERVNQMTLILQLAGEVKGCRPSAVGHTMAMQFAHETGRLAQELRPTGRRINEGA